MVSHMIKQEQLEFDLRWASHNGWLNVGSIQHSLIYPGLTDTSLKIQNCYNQKMYTAVFLIFTLLQKPHEDANKLISYLVALLMYPLSTH